MTKRFQGGGTLLVAYTNAKLMSNTDTLTSWLEGGTTGGVGGFRTGTTWRASVRFPLRMFRNAWSSATCLTCPLDAARNSSAA